MKPHLEIGIFRNLAEQEIENEIGFSLGDADYSTSESCVDRVEHQLVKVKDRSFTWVHIDTLPARSWVDTYDGVDGFDFMSTNRKSGCACTFCLCDATVDCRQSLEVGLEPWAQRRV